MLLTKEQIFLNQNLNCKDDVLKFIASKAHELNIVKDEKILFNELIEREKVYSTAVEDLIAIPHSKNENIKKSKLFFLQLNNPISWDSPDNYQVKVMFTILLPKNKTNKRHLDILSSIATNLLEEDFQEFILKIDNEETLLNYFYSKFKEVEK